MQRTLLTTTANSETPTTDRMIYRRLDEAHPRRRGIGANRL